MREQSTRWTVAYYFGWAVSLGTVTAIAAQCVFVEGQDRGSGSDAFWAVGALVGLLLGAWLAHATRRSSGMHRTLRWGGGSFVCVGLVSAVVMFVLSAERRHTGIFLGGLEEFVLAFVGLIVAGIGACFLLAGCSGRHLAPSLAAADGAPLV